MKPYQLMLDFTIKVLWYPEQHKWCSLWLHRCRYGCSHLTHWGRDKMAATFQTTFWNAFSWMQIVQSTPVISHQLGAKICERELSGSPVISREGPNSRLAGSQSHILTSAPLKPKQYLWWAIMNVLTFPGTLQTSKSHQQQITTSHIIF